MCESLKSLVWRQNGDFTMNLKFEQDRSKIDDERKSPFWPSGTRQWHASLVSKEKSRHSCTAQEMTDFVVLRLQRILCGKSYASFNFMSFCSLN